MTLISIIVKHQGQQCPIKMDDSSTVEELMKKLEEAFGVRGSCQRIVHVGKKLPNDKTLQSLGIKDGAVLHMVKSLDSPPSSSNLNPNFEKDLRHLLRSHFTDPDCKKILTEFDRLISQFVDSINYEDIDRLASVWKE